MHTLLKTHHEKPIPIKNHYGDEKTVMPVKVELGSSLRRKLLHMHFTSFDWEQGGLKTPVKFLDRDSIEYSLTQAASHDRTEESMARKSLDAGLNIIDSAWGGIYQYSTQNDWQHPHHRKTMAAQGGCLRLYSLAYALMHELRYLTAARQIFRYMLDFLLSPEGAFYDGQDDNVSGIEAREYFSLPHSQRILYGIPAISINLYARETAWAIEALASFYEFTGEDAAREIAVDAAQWLVANCRLGNHGFKHALSDEESLLLGDNLATARAMLQLYRITNEPSYLRHASDTANFIGKRFKAKEGGFNTRVQHEKSIYTSQQIDENISLTRFFNLLSFYTGNPDYKKLALHGLRYLVIPQVATARMEEAGILLAEEELNTSPTKIVIHGGKHDPDAEKLFKTALRNFGWYKLISWDEKKYTKAYATISKEHYQSKPVYNVDKLAWLIKSV